MADRGFAHLLRIQAQMGDAAAGEVAQQPLDRGDRAERVVAHAERQDRRAQGREALHQRAALALAAPDRRAPVGVLELGAAAAPGQRHAARRVLHPAEPPRREITAQRAHQRHHQVPFPQHRYPAARRVIAPVRVLRAHREDAAHQVVRGRQAQRHPADAVRDHVDRLAGKGRRGVTQHRLGIALAPVEPARLEPRQHRRARFADAAVVVDDRIAAVAMQPGREAEVVAAAHRGGRVDHHHRARRERIGRRGLTPDEAADRITVPGDDGDRLGPGVGRVVHVARLSSRIGHFSSHTRSACHAHSA